MKLHVFQSADGDCLLVQGAGGGSVLCDGGRKTSMKDLRQVLHDDFGPSIDAAYISHVDNDHISGVLQLIEDEVEWRVFDHHGQLGTSPNPKPKFPRPPTIGGIFHNAFRDQIGDNDTSDGIEAALAVTSSSLFAANVPALTTTAAELQNIATGIPEALKVSGLAPPLGIRINELPGKPAVPLLIATGNPANDQFSIGSMKFTIVGPTKKELKDLKKGWRNWLNANPDVVTDLREELQKRIDEFSAGAAGSPFDLGKWNGIAPVKGVTTPNVASLVLMVEENGHTLLLTGDAQPDILLDHLTAAGFLQGGSLHVDVLKVQHHGSSHNVTKKFARLVSADNYVFCANGRNGNPDRPVIDIIYNSRLGTNPKDLALAPAAAGRPFKFWFSTSSDQIPQEASHRDDFLDTEAQVASKVAQSGGLLTAKFNGRPFVAGKPFVTIDVP
jgi:hypothetical protein